MAINNSGYNPAAYLGVNAPMPPNLSVHRNDPTANNYENFNIGDFWLNKGTIAVPARRLWVLMDKARNIATWILLVNGSAGPIIAIQGDTGSVITPTLGIDNIIANTATLNCGASVNIAGNPATSTLTLNVTDALDNTLIGKGSGIAGITGDHNTAIGKNTLAALTTGTNNAALGSSSLRVLTTGNYNLAVGQGLQSLTTGTGNIAVGYGSGLNLITGNYNVIIGTFNSGCGANYTGAESSNISIRNDGVTGESNVIRIGTMGGGGAQQNRCFIAGITGVAVVGVNVQVDGNGQLGVVVSSKRYKENIKPMESFSSSIMDLRPVTFNFKKHPDIPAWGLIAEEVAGIFPELVVYDKEDKPESVKYQDLSVLLLNELQKLSRRVEHLETLLEGKQ
jgi:hypothetical protein